MNKTLHTLMIGISKLSSGEACIVLAGLIALVWIAQKRRQDAVCLFFATVVGSALSSFLKGVFKTPRPPIPDALTSWGFPSGHAMSTTVLMLTLAALLSRLRPDSRRLFYAGGLVWMGFVGISRVYLQMHYPMDVLGGYVFGGLFVMCWLKFAFPPQVKV